MRKKDTPSSGSIKARSLRSVSPERTVAHRLDRKLLGQILGDIEFILRGGGTVLFAVDAYDILKFCFPFESNSQKGAGLPELSDYFAALSFALDRDEARPLLLPEYLGEILAFTSNIVTSHDGNGFNDPMRLARVEEALENEIGDQNITTAGEFLDFIQSKLDLVLPLLVATTSGHGILELDRLIKSRLVGLSDVSSGVKPELTQTLSAFARDYRPNGDFIAECEAAFFRLYPNKDHVRRATSNRADASALDRIVQMNVALEKGFSDGTVAAPTKVLLLSSSVRLRRLVNALRATDRQENRTRRLDVVRVPDQVFAFALATRAQMSSDELDMSRAAEIVETVSWLGDIYRTEGELREQGDMSHEGRQRLETLHKNVTTVLAPYQNRCENLITFALLRNDFRASLGRPRHVKRASAKTDAVVRLKSWFEKFGDVERLAEKALDAQTQLVRTHTVLAHHWCIGIESGNTLSITEQATRDRVRGAVHALPWLLQVANPVSKEVIRRAEVAFFGGSDDLRTRRRRLVGAFEAVLPTDGPVLTDMGEDELQLVRAFLLLAVSEKSSEAAAVAAAKQIAGSGSRDAAREACYVLAWAFRRSGDFTAAVSMSETAIRSWPNDPRFYHARSLANYALMRSSTSNVFESLRIRSDLEIAIKHYVTYPFPSDAWRKAIIASCMNGMAYLWLIDGSTREGVDNARRWIDAAKKEIEGHAYIFPEFFHTEAAIELQEAHTGRGAARMAKLAEAQKAARKAIKYAPERAEYSALLDEIVLEIDRQT